MKHTYLVTIEANDAIPKEVVDNYIPRALKRYPKHDDQKAFDGVAPPSHILVLNLPVEQDEEQSVADTVRLIKEMKNYFAVLKRLK